MIPEIGILIALYVFLQVLPSKWTVVNTITRTVIAAAAITVLFDLALRGFTDSSLATMLKGKPEAVNGPEGQREERIESEPSKVSVTKADGGSITTKLGHGFAIAKNSALHREWIAIHDPSLPADLDGTPGIKMVYVSSEYRGDYNYKANVTLIPREPLSSIEVRFLTFDVWGDHVRSLVYEEVIDLPAGKKHQFEGAWNVFSENEAEKHYASIAYVSRVRLANGKVVEASVSPVVAEARKFTGKFTREDLEPETKKPAKEEKT
ncbi:hypothetical protein L0156_20340 [bacterium]|nr:hypothetical protein [bacterium]